MSSFLLILQLTAMSANVLEMVANCNETTVLLLGKYFYLLLIERVIQ